MPRVVLVALFIACTAIVGVQAQSWTDDHQQAQETRVRGYWVDPSTGLMWAGRDNGKAVTWGQAVKYCRDLRLAGYSDWRLATIDELEGLIDKNAYAPQRVANVTYLHFNKGLKVNGGLVLTAADQWSGSRRLDVTGKPTGFALFFDFVNVLRNDEDLGVRPRRNALCARDSRATPSPPSNDAPKEADPSLSEPGYWVDSSTGLMWSAKDNGKDVDLGEAVNYCRDLHLARYSDWRLATIDELERVHDSIVDGRRTVERFLTGDQWSGSPVTDHRGFPPRLVWYLNVDHGTRAFDEPNYGRAKRAFCVRDSIVQHASPSGASGANTLYWLDPSTGLMWAGRDNLGRLDHWEATQYCRRLRLARYSDWRLATIEELQGIYDSNAESPGANPRSRWREPEPVAFHVKGNLFLTGKQWSNTRANDSESSVEDAWGFDFSDGSRFKDKAGLVYRALCVRGSSK